MLIVNDDHLHRAGVRSLAKQCSYCKKALAAYPFIMSDDTQTVYHAPCALQLTMDIITDLFTFLSPPPPYRTLYVLTAPQEEGGTHVLVNEYSPD